MKYFPRCNEAAKWGEWRASSGPGHGSCIRQPIDWHVLRGEEKGWWCDEVGGESEGFSWQFHILVDKDLTKNGLMCPARFEFSTEKCCSFALRWPCDLELPVFRCNLAIKRMAILIFIRLCVGFLRKLHFRLLCSDVRLPPFVRSWHGVSRPSEADQPEMFCMH